MKRYLLLFLLFPALSGYAQNTINNYKYVLVPERFSFLKQDHQYGLNSEAKTLLEQKGFTVYFDDTDLPNEIANNKCRAMNVDLIEKGGMFTTSLTLVLKDCQGNVIFKGKEGKSREKEYYAAYNEALKNTFASLNEVPYTFTGEAGKIDPPSSVPSRTVVTHTNQPAVAAEVTQASGTLYAQATANGFQLIDTTPKKVLTLYKTSIQDCFIADNGQAKGIVLKKDGKWFFEYYNNDKLISEGLMIKF
ncbi:MAG: hypothetical protein P0Y49_13440 [Candidatus Pedobacter colombiensis]|uniref:WG repeat-containing protein n=1 Tax=Candidatus Pedobacter colombiensis TaxID=3121371 RepID=A0AAJ5W767_9SPHI|nr:hypothetical protein [Pedobacter sp.]WEK17802.1 MAG: hypothetical protein P0Y49_13440 [Pedobacter sp.]